MSHIEVFEPISAESLYQIEEVTAEQVQQVFKQARAAKQRMRQTTAEQRAAVIRKVLIFLAEKREWLVDEIARETGRSRLDILVGDIVQMAEDADWLARRSPEILKDKKVPGPITLIGKKSRIFNEPRGVVLVISPWNIPMQIGLLASLTAFAAGNAVILKPSEETPLKNIWKEILAIDPLLQEAIQVVQGSGATAQQLIAQRPDMVAFTGSVRTGQKILAQAADMVIPVVMELGAKDFMIVFDDVELKRTVPAAAWGAMHNGGQSCTSVERLSLQEGIASEFIEQITVEIKGLTVCSAKSPDLGNKDVGGMITPGQMEIVKRQVADAREKGATIHCGGDVVPDSPSHFQPTVISGITPDMEIHNAETFGPVLPIYTFKTEEEIVDTHNATDFGLSASVWSRDTDRAERVARALEAGCVCINDIMITEGNAELPFGGVKYSGFGRAKGEEGLLGFTQSKSVIASGMSKSREPNWYPYTRRKYHLMGLVLDSLYLKKGLAKWTGLIKGLIGLKF
jgi:acyl-CoA reductase-like NAD-dependent aldehyde dehydrogenase